MSPECDKAEQYCVDIIITLAEKITNAQHFIKSVIFQVHIVGIQRLRQAIGTFYGRNRQQIFERLPGIVRANPEGNVTPPELITTRLAGPFTAGNSTDVAV